MSYLLIHYVLCILSRLEIPVSAVMSSVVTGPARTVVLFAELIHWKPAVDLYQMTFLHWMVNIKIIHIKMVSCAVADILNY